MSDNVKVSVILTPRRTGAFLAQCVDSLLAQTFSGFELIAVNGGDSRISEILTAYAAKDSRVRVRSTENCGEAPENIGLSEAHGEYVLFANGEDFYDPKLLEKTCATATANQADIVLCGGYRHITASGKQLPKPEYVNEHMLPFKVVFSSVQVPNDLFQLSTPDPSNKLYRRSFLATSDLRFQALPVFGDYCFTLNGMAAAKRICAVRDRLVYCRSDNKIGAAEYKAEEAGCIFRAIYALRDELQTRQLLERLRVAFERQVISTVSFCLRSAKTTAGRDAVLNGAASEAFRQLNLLGHDDAYYGSETVCTNAHTIEASLKVYQARLRLKDSARAEAVATARTADTIKVSVIIPVYNTEPYLDECLASVCGQTLREIEILCIDDGSADSSLDKLKTWALRDARISVWTKPNGGQSQARNIGMRHAKGEYLYFMDSDDILEPNALETLWAKADRDKLDMLLFDASVFYEAQNDDWVRIVPEKQYIRKYQYDENIPGVEMFSQMEMNNEYTPSPCMYLIRSELCAEHQLWYREGIVYEDNLFTLHCMLKAGRVSHLQKALYRRRVRCNSTMTGNHHFQNTYSVFCVYMGILKLIDQHEGMMTAFQREMINKHAVHLLKNAQKKFLQLSADEQNGIYGMEMSEYYRFEAMVAQVQRTKAEALQAQAEASLHYRLSEALHKVRKSLRNNGMAGTCRRVLRRLHLM